MCIQHVALGRATSGVNIEYVVHDQVKSGVTHSNPGDTCLRDVSFVDGGALWSEGTMLTGRHRDGGVGPWSKLGSTYDIAR